MKRRIVALVVIFVVVFMSMMFGVQVKAETQFIFPILQAPWTGMAEITQGTQGNFSHTGGDKYGIDITWGNSKDVKSIGLEDENFPVHPCFQGTVVYSAPQLNGDKQNGYGNLVIIKHSYNGQEFYSLYGHLEEKLIEINTRVDCDTLIGFAGKTGKRNGKDFSQIHLHFHLQKELTVNGIYTSIPINNLYIRNTSKNQTKFDTFNNEMLKDDNIIGNRIFESFRLKLPELAYPENDQFEVSLNTYFVWSSFNEANKHIIEIKINGFLKEEHEIESNYYFPSSAFPEGSQIEWRVKSFANGGRSSPYSISSKFITKIIKGVYPPELESPIDREEITHSPIQFRWKCPDLNKKYKIQVSKNFNFTNLVIDQENVSLSWFGAEDNTKYYWRVLDLTTRNNSILLKNLMSESNVSSEIRSFTTKFNTQPGGCDKPPEKPQLISPKDEIKLTNPVTLTFNAVPCATKYEVAVKQLSTGKNIVYASTNGKTYYKIEVELDPGNYQWNARAGNDKDWSGWSTPACKFTVDTTPPPGGEKPILTDPINNNPISLPHVFRWSKVNNYDYYDFEIFFQGKPKYYQRASSEGDCNIDPRPELIVNNSYTWKVTAHLKGSTETRVSDIGSFYLKEPKPDNDCTEPKILGDFPKDGQKYSLPMMIKWENKSGIKDFSLEFFNQDDTQIFPSIDSIHQFEYELKNWPEPLNNYSRNYFNVRVRYYCGNSYKYSDKRSFRLSPPASKCKYEESGRSPVKNIYEAQALQLYWQKGDFDQYIVKIFHENVSPVNPIYKKQIITKEWLVAGEYVQYTIFDYLYAGKYSWTLTPICNDGLEGNETDKLYFEVYDYYKCNPPVITKPYNGETVTLPYQIAWKSVERDDSYTIIVWDSSQTTKIINEQIQSTHTDTVNFEINSKHNLIPGNTYFVSIQTICAIGTIRNPSVESSKILFQVKSNPMKILPPVLISPLNNSQYYNSDSFYGALQGMKAKYPNNSDIQNISLQFELTIIENHITEKTEWLNDWKYNAEMIMPSNKAYEIWLDHFTGLDKFSEVNIQWKVTIKNKNTNEQMSSEYWTYKLINKLNTPQPPTLLSPYNRQTNVPTDVTFSWNPGANAAGYYLYLYDVLDNNRLVWDSGYILGTNVRPSSYLLQEGKKYSWKVQSHNLKGYSSHSETFVFFTKGGDIAKPDLPNRVYPTDGTINVERPVTLRWDAAPRATHYQIWILRNESIILSQNNIQGTTFIIPSDIISEGEEWYQWIIQAYNSAGRSPESIDWYFRTKKLEVPEPPTLLSPYNEQTNVPTDVTFSWNPGARAAGYYLYLYDVSDNNRLVWDSGYITGNSIRVPGGYLQEKKKYSWKMQSYNSAGYSNHSATYYFYTKDYGKVDCPDVPNRISPVDGANNVERTPTLQWNATPRATYYKIWILRNDRIVFEQNNITATSISVPSGIITEDGA